MTAITASHDLDTATVTRVARAIHMANAPAHADSWFSLPLQAELYFINAARAAMKAPQKATKIAQAIHEAVCPDDIAWNYIPAAWEDLYMDMANAAIKANAKR